MFSSSQNLFRSILKIVYSVKTGFHILKTGFRHFSQQRIQIFWNIGDKGPENEISLNNYFQKL